METVAVANEALYFENKGIGQDHVVGKEVREGEELGVFVVGIAVAEGFHEFDHVTLCKTFRVIQRVCKTEIGHGRGMGEYRGCHLY